MEKRILIDFRAFTSVILKHMMSSYELVTKETYDESARRKEYGVLYAYSKRDGLLAACTRR